MPVAAGMWQCCRARAGARLTRVLIIDHSVADVVRVAAVAGSQAPVVLKTEDIVPLGRRQLELLEGIGARLLERNCTTEDEVIEGGREADALIVISAPISARVIAELRRCRVIGRFGAGLDNVDVEAATAAGVQVVNVPAASMEEVSDHALAMIFALSRRLTVLGAAVRDGRWDSLEGGEGVHRLKTCTVGVIGLGHIGGLLARKLAALGIETIAYDPFASEEALAACSAVAADLHELMRRSDFVSVHAPLTAQTRYMIGAEEIALMKPSAYLVNVSRGGIVDQAALTEALLTGRIAGAGIDAFEHEPPSVDDPLMSMPNVIITPHSAYHSLESVEELRHTVVADVVGVLSGSPPLNPVNSIATIDADGGLPVR